jgi:hypothetical protein
MSDGEDDLISALHDDLLGSIISRLPVNEAARTAALASRWRHVWRSTPLVLSDEHLPETTARILADHPGPFRRVVLFLPTLSPELAEIPRLLAAKPVRELMFIYRKRTAAQRTSRSSPCLPADILRCASLEQLLLAFWTLPDHFPHIPLAFSHLRMLSLIRVTMSDQDLDHLIAASPVLETLLITSRIKRLHLRSRSLRCVLANLVEELAVVEAPLLERLVFLNLRNVRDHLVRAKIASTSSLRVLGYMEPMINKLQINGNIINVHLHMSFSIV